MSPSRFHPVYPDHQVEPPPPPRGYTYHSPTYRGVDGWDPYTREWAHGDILPLGHGSSYYHESEGRPFGSHQEAREASVGSYHQDGDVELASKKRRKGPDDDGEYQPPGEKRVSNTLLFITSSYFH